MTSDAELLQQSRAGHRDAFAGLVERYQNLVCAVTFGGTGDRALAADLAQETFVTAWTALPTLRDESRFRSWLCGIARNLVGKARRKSRSIEATGELVDPTPDAEAQIEDLRSEALVREILDDMDDTYREPLVLFYWEGRSTKEVAAQLGLSVSAVEQRLSRGRRRIKVEVEARVDRALQSAKPDRKFSATVLAAIEGLPAPAAEPSGVSKTAIAAGLVAASILGWFAWSSVGGRGPDATTSASPPPALATVDVEIDESESVRATPAMSKRTTSTQPVDGGRALAETSVIAIGGNLELEHYPNHAVVNLLGGPSGLTEERKQEFEQGAALPYDKDGKITDFPTRRISGEVVDTDGDPVASAVVIAGHSLGIGRGRMSGQGGAVTDPQGRFSFSAPARDGAVAAVAHGLGFSGVQSIEGTEDIDDVELVLEGISTLEGNLVFEGRPTKGYVSVGALLSNGESGLGAMRRTDEGGHFRIDGLPPGKYLVYASAEAGDMDGWEGEQGPNDRITLELAPGADTQHDFEFSRGVTIELRATRPMNLAYYVFPGTQIETWSEAKLLLRDANARSITVGSTPDDEAAFAMAQGIPAEPMTVCAVRPFARFEESSYTGCKKLPAPASDDATVEVTFDPPAD